MKFIDLSKGMLIREKRIAAGNAIEKTMAK
jgi:hypothetical protein